MKVLFSHTNFPGQFGAFGAWLATQGWDVVFATGRQDAKPPPGTRLFRFAAAAEGAAQTHRHARGLDKALRTAEAFAAAAIKLRDSGYAPDIVVAHSGWGAGTYAPAVWPEAVFLPYVEWWYRYPRADADPDESAPADTTALRANAAARNAPMLLDLSQADNALCPAAFQASQFPDWVRPKLLIAPDGVDCATFRPNPAARAALATHGPPPDAEIVTYATRGMEPYRGFPAFMRALALLQRTRPRLHAVIGGEDRVAYGPALPEGDSWKRRMLAELDLDLSRVHFTGLLPLDTYRRLLQGTDAHVYLTLPFVLSWSFHEAMSVGCPLIASDVAPVREAVGALSGGATGLAAGVSLVDHHDIEALTAAIAAILDDPAQARARGSQARAHALRTHDRAWAWPHRAALLRQLVGARALRQPPPPEQERRRGSSRPAANVISQNAAGAGTDATATERGGP